MGIDISLLIQSLPFMLKGAGVTLQIAIVSILCGIAGGVFIGILNCRKLRRPLLGGFLQAFVYAIRGTPLFVQVLITYYALPELIGFSFSPFAAGILALSINSSAYISESIRGGINAISEGQWEAAYVLGLSPWQTLRGIILPQMFRIAIPSLTNELASLVKETSILMVIGVTELTKVSKDIVSRELDPMTIYIGAALIYLIITSTISAAAKTIEGKLHS